MPPAQRRRLRVLAAHVSAAASEPVIVPLRIGADLQALPAELARLRAAIDAAAANREFRQGAALQDLLHIVEPKPPLSVDECCPETPEQCLEFFLREGFVCVKEIFTPDQLHRLQGQWRRARAPVRELWEEAKVGAGNVSTQAPSGCV